MTRYVPIPAIPIDPRNEREIVEQASEFIRERSNGLLSDFSEGSPLRAIIEGQAFAFNEFLFYFNQIPDYLLTEWIGPFLGAQRGAGSSALVEVEVFLGNPASEDFSIPEGFIVNAPLINKDYSLISPIVISRGQISGSGTFRCTTRGTEGNCEAGAITNFQPITGVERVVNQPGFGGEDIETLRATKERFLSLIRRRVPTSEDDWRGFFLDLFGYGTISFIRFDPYHRVINFRVLAPGLVPPSPFELELAQSFIEAQVPASYRVSLKPIPRERVDIEVELSYKKLPVTPREVAREVREVLLDALEREGLPSDVSLSTLDLNGYLSQNLPTKFQGGQEYKNPDINSLKVFMKPQGVVPSRCITKIREYDPSLYLKEGDLLKDGSDLYPVLQSFNPLYPSKSFYSIPGFLQLRLVKGYVAGGEYKAGEVILDPVANLLRVVLTPFTASGDISRDFSFRFVSELKTPKEWEIGESYSRGSQEVYNPDVLLAEPGDFSSTVFFPSESLINHPVWTVERSFLRGSDTTKLGTLQSAGIVSGGVVNPVIFERGVSYTQGQYLSTPPVILGEEGYSPQDYFVDPSKGVIQSHYLVLENFVYEETSETMRSDLTILEESGFIRSVNLVSLEDSVFSVNSQKYKARFPVGKYLTDRAGNNYIVTTPFTPFTLNLETYITSGFLLKVDYTPVALVEPIFRLNPGSTTLIASPGTVSSYRVNRSFTPVFNPEVYIELGLLDKVSNNLNQVSFFDSNYSYEDTLLDNDGNLFKVIRPFSPEGETLRELESLGYVQRLITGVNRVQSGEEFVSIPGDVNISIKRDGLPVSSFFVAQDSSLVPAFFGEALF